MTDKLKPCPFCGGNAEMTKENHGIGRPFVYRVGCLTINCCGRVMTQTGQHTKAEASELWNTRTTL
jgi:Lar family restriction alleviation protein